MAFASQYSSQRQCLGYASHATEQGRVDLLQMEWNAGLELPGTSSALSTGI